MFDQNNDGFLERFELEEIMGKDIIDEDTWQKILSDCDENGDGKIDVKEFITLLKSYNDD